MYAEERQQAIADLVQDRGRLSVAELATQFGVTTETVRRDLSLLERAGLIRRVHGGAIPASSLTSLETAVSDRDVAQAEQKDRVARAALAYLPRDGGSVLIDAGTTTARLVSLVSPESTLTVFTNAVPIASRLAGHKHVELHLLPGRVRRTTQAAVGEETVAALAHLRTDVAFVGTNGLTVAHGLSTPDPSEAAAKRAMVATGRQVVVLVDSSKIGLESTICFARLDQTDVVVTDDGISDLDHKALIDAGVQVVVA